MQHGAGRYAYPSKAAFVKDFFDPLYGNIKLPDGSYTKSKLIEEHGFESSDFVIKLRHDSIDKSSSDYSERVYIWNNSGFTISENAEFVIKGNQRYVKNMAVYSYQDDFDFYTNNPVLQFGNEYILRPKIDPNNIGVRVKIQFANKEEVLTYEDLHGESYSSKYFLEEQLNSARENSLNQQEDIIKIKDWSVQVSDIKSIGSLPSTLVAMLDVISQLESSKIIGNEIGDQLNVNSKSVALDIYKNLEVGDTVYIDFPDMEYVNAGSFGGFFAGSPSGLYRKTADGIKLIQTIGDKTEKFHDIISDTGGNTHIVFHQDSIDGLSDQSLEVLKQFIENGVDISRVVIDNRSGKSADVIVGDELYGKLFKSGTGVVLDNDGNVIGRLNNSADLVDVVGDDEFSSVENFTSINEVDDRFGEGNYVIEDVDDLYNIKKTHTTKIAGQVIAVVPRGNRVKDDTSGKFYFIEDVIEDIWQGAKKVSKFIAAKADEGFDYFFGDEAGANALRAMDAFFSRFAIDIATNHANDNHPPKIHQLALRVC